ncbi:arginase family protein [Fusibacter ferrireducens]|uniref:Arginase family protein n=1 Tax=Fusibacter ferrireducens TaxID=2785058 RepID=A0ABR9ZYV5_9FIRM|nr:arginase family protein [Fusibacter ferrireducens]MBF4695556.1 arginase family protein [Fusibacter ferrireducens]
MKIRLAGIPSNVGALNTGTELGPKFFRNANLREQLEKHHQVLDLGDLEVDNVSFRHNIAPVRNWPAPKILWQKIIDQKTWFVEDELTLILGGGCSTFTGVFMNFHNQYGERAEILSIDHHIDMKIPDPEVCMGATAYTLWFLTHKNKWIQKPAQFNNAKITSMGFDKSNIDDSFPIEGIHLLDKELVLDQGPAKVAEAYHRGLDKDAKVIIHLDLDVINQADLSSVYMPSPKGLPLETVTQLLKAVCKDERIAGMVITEFSPNEAQGAVDAERVVHMICSALENR